MFTQNFWLDCPAGSIAFLWQHSIPSVGGVAFTMCSCAMNVNIPARKRSSCVALNMFASARNVTMCNECYHTHPTPTPTVAIPPHPNPNCCVAPNTCSVQWMWSHPTPPQPQLLRSITHVFICTERYHAPPHPNPNCCVASNMCSCAMNPPTHLYQKILQRSINCFLKWNRTLSLPHPHPPQPIFIKESSDVASTACSSETEQSHIITIIINRTASWKNAKWQKPRGRYPWRELRTSLVFQDWLGTSFDGICGALQCTCINFFVQHNERIWQIRSVFQSVALRPKLAPFQADLLTPFGPFARFMHFGYS